VLGVALLLCMVVGTWVADGFCGRDGRRCGVQWMPVAPAGGAGDPKGARRLSSHKFEPEVGMCVSLPPRWGSSL
jgi:hypothetical protein